MNPEYLKLYDGVEYFLGNYGNHEQKCYDFNQLRYGDQLPAICYAFGYTSFDQVRELFGFEEEGKSGEPFIGAMEQLMILMELEIDRYPKSVLDIGGGRGEVAVAFSFWKDIKVQLIEPSSATPALLKMTQEKFGIYEKVQLWNKELKIAQRLVDWSNIDTVIMTESIEHIEREDFDKAYLKYIRPTLRKNKGLLIITNWVSFHPIELMLPFHCRRVDDGFYDDLCKDAKEVIFREGSHIALQF
jgi:hypothetical protein